jgi:trimeric autotransporter adhesin
MALTDNAVAYWKLEESSGTRADEIGGHTLTDNNTVTGATGKLGNAAQFTAANSEWLSVADHADFAFTTAFSGQAWIYPDSVTGNHEIAGQWNWGSDPGWSIRLAGAELLCLIAASSGDLGSNYGQTTDASLSTATWYHVVWVYDGSGANNAAKLKIYLDGTQKTLSFTGTIPTSLQGPTTDVVLGRFTGIGNYWSGRQDAVGLWSRALTSTEDTTLYNSGAGLEYPWTTANVPAYVNSYRRRRILV